MDLAKVVCGLCAWILVASISAAGARCAAYVIRTDEDRIIARHARELLRSASA